MFMGIINESKKAQRRGFIGIFRSKLFIAAIVILLASGAGVKFWMDKNSSTQTTATTVKQSIVKKDDIQIAIEADGKVVAEDGVELSFPVSGDNLEVESVFVKEGDKVKKGDKIATVKTETLEFNVQSAYSSYLSALASYKEKLDGPTDEEIAKSKSSIEQSKISLEQAKISQQKTEAGNADKIIQLENVIEKAKENLEKNQNSNNSEDVRDAYDDLFDSAKTIVISLNDMLIDSDKIIGVDDQYLNDSFEKSLGVKDKSSYDGAVTSYKKAKNLVGESESLLNNLSKSSSYSAIDDLVKKTKETLTVFESHFYYMKLMLDASITSDGFSQSTLDGFKSTISSSKSSINNKISTLEKSEKSVDNVKDTIDDYRDAYDDAVRNLATTKSEIAKDYANYEKNIRAKELSIEQSEISYQELIAPITDAELASAKSQLTSASISLEKSKLELEKATIKSPIDGEVAMLNYKAGDIIVDNSSSDPVATIINNDTLFIEVNIEEADISKIKVGQKAQLTFDALDGLNLDGEVSFISLTSTAGSNDIVTYLVRVLVDNKGENAIREGMTAFVNFISAEVNDVLVIPVAAVQNVSGKPSIKLLSGEIVNVTTGFTDGKSVEIISGLKEGDVVVY